MSTRSMTAKQADSTPAATFREILVPTDLSDPSGVALAQAAVLAARFGGRLTLYHALEFPDHEYGHWAFGERPSVWDEQERLAREQLADCTGGLAVPCEAVVERTASPVRALQHRIETTAPDLTVMATQGRGALAHMLLGSVAEQVVEHCHCPVLCVRGGQSIAQTLASRIVLATDLSEASRDALRKAATLAAAFGGELVVVHAGTRSASQWARSDADEPWKPYTAAERWLQPLPEHVTVRVVADAAPAWKAVLRVAAEENAGLVVVSRRRDPASGEAPGSEAARVVRHAHCSVLVV